MMSEGNLQAGSQRLASSSSSFLVPVCVIRQRQTSDMHVPQVALNRKMQGLCCPNQLDACCLPKGAMGCPQATLLAPADI